MAPEFPDLSGQSPAQWPSGVHGERRFARTDCNQNWLLRVTLVQEVQEFGRGQASLAQDRGERAALDHAVLWLPLVRT
jgi:hypothetical protein